MNKFIAAQAIEKIRERRHAVFSTFIAAQAIEKTPERSVPPR